MGNSKEIMVKSLTWQQVNAWRLAQHYLTSRLQRQDFVAAVTGVSGIQAQLMSAAELALWARVEGLSPKDVQSALWHNHSLIKTWAMRGTLHLIAASDLPLYVAARSFYDNRKWLNYFAYYGIEPAQYHAFMAAVPEVLGGEPMTREALAAAIAGHTGVAELRELILASSWGSPLKPCAFRGDLCFGPSQGQNVTFVNPRKWIGNWEAIEPEQALLEMVRRYLRAYGPATPVDFVRWWWGGAGLVQAKKIFQSLDDELETVAVEGWRALALRSTLEPMQNAEKSGSVNLLPLFDAYTLGIGRDIEPLLPKVYKSQVYRPQGWISAVVLVDGYINAVWAHKSGRSQTTVKVNLFSAPTNAIKQGIEAEAERLGVFLNTQVAIMYEAKN
jgi:hypothetical protein